MQLPDAPSHAHALPLLRWLDAPPAPTAHGRAQRVAVVGAGITGLGAAWALQASARVTLFEAEHRLGGHANTVDLTLEGQRHGVDTGFLVCNARTYPLLLRLMGELGVALVESRMGFSVQHRGLGLEWAGSDLNGVFAQRRNALRPAFLGMLREVLRFNRLATAIAQRGDESALRQPLEAFLRERGFGPWFRDAYLLPMIACIWSCPTGQMLAFPVGTLIRFCHNHGLLQVNGRPQWLTVRGGAKQYVQRLRERLHDVRAGCPVRGVQRMAQGVRLHLSAGRHEDFDAVILACHSDHASALLQEPSARERQLLSAIRYQPNRAVLHLDTSVLPQRRRAWAAWNFEAGDEPLSTRQPVCLHYLINELQPLPWRQPVIVSMNPLREPRHVQREFSYEHPVFDEGAIRAQQELPAIQGQGGVWFAGAWTRYGFHEDGLLSGLTAAHAVCQAVQA